MNISHYDAHMAAIKWVQNLKKAHCNYKTDVGNWTAFNHYSTKWVGLGDRRRSCSACGDVDIIRPWVRVEICRTRELHGRYSPVLAFCNAEPDGGRVVVELCFANRLGMAVATLDLRGAEKQRSWILMVAWDIVCKTQANEPTISNQRGQDSQILTAGGINFRGGVVPMLHFRWRQM